MRWVTFDCFGTLVDWHSGFSAILRPLVGLNTPEVLRTYHRFERLLEAEKPHRLYKEVLTKYKGSIFTVEARKRYRELRGDEVN